MSLLSLWDSFVGLVGKIRCPFIQEELPKQIKQELMSLLAEDHYIVLTRRKTHLSTYLISLACLLRTGRFAYWCHTFINIEGDNSAPIFVEAVYPAVRYSNFDRCFDVASFCLLVPKGVSPAEWTILIQRTKDLVGVDYDTLFDHTDPRKVNCVEMVRLALQSLPDYDTRFPKFEAMIKKYKTLTPQMLFDSGEFRIAMIYHGRL